MRRMTTPRRRGGFTLVELLTVVAILALLAAIATAAFLRVRGSETERASNATLQKLKSGLDERWKAVIDDAAEDSTKGRIPPAVLTFAGGDKDRARVIWTYCKLKNELPTTIAEACNPVFVPDMTTGAAVQVLAPKSVFTAGFKTTGKNVQGVPNPDPELERSRTVFESAACFHWSLTATATRGKTFDLDGVSQQIGELGSQLQASVGGTPQAAFSPRVFKDSYGNPVSFLRQGYTAELNGPPYAKTGAGTNRDAVDPTARLVTFTGGWTAGHLQAFWRYLFPLATDGLQYTDPATAAVLPVPSSQHAVLPIPSLPAQPQFRAVFATYPTDPTGSAFAANWVPTLISAGSDKAFASDLGQGDDLLSFRLGREGKGN